MEPFEEFSSKQEASNSLPNVNNLTEEERLFKELIVKALDSGEQSKFEFIKNYSEYRAVKICQSSLKKVIKMFDRIAKAIHSEYNELVLCGKDDFNLLCVFRQYLEVKRYYEQELATANDMLDEYDNYTWSGHLVDQYLLFKTRPDTDLVDTRKKKHGTK
jgi:uncharacterized protein YktA (UPF0223 family)